MSLTSIPSNPVPDEAVDGYIEAADGVRLRFARWPAGGMKRKGTVCIFPGRAEMIEKYFEVVRDLRERGFAVAVLDWRGQGGSARALADPRKGHVGDFAEFQLDLDAFMKQIVLPDCPPPYFALAHSMGGANILRALHEERRWFDRVVLCAPMIDLRIQRYRNLSRLFTRFMAAVGFGHRYIPGGSAVAVTNRPFYGNPVSSDPVRYERIAAIVEADPALGLGSPTMSWIAASFRQIDAFAQPEYPAKLHQPILIIAAGDDRLVSTVAAEKFAIRLRAGAIIVIPGSRHEILMERESIRSQFWAAFDAFVPGSAA
ncbi:MAG: alpha/beta hydrolase [Xanthobacteraceae bacterium]|nr:alpha/beta hydrolase [Xanthobacteraceae bacterium]MBX3550520.1 alpha/beta hydrolase [Xanthobacteraceae bacterium]MCW5676921.1 alpha/beta hydrolase [Xanthobacteraceae bacterium]